MVGIRRGDRPVVFSLVDCFLICRTNESASIRAILPHMKGFVVPLLLGTDIGISQLGADNSSGFAIHFSSLITIGVKLKRRENHASEYGKSNGIGLDMMLSSLVEVLEKKGLLTQDESEQQIKANIDKTIGKTKYRDIQFTK
jgi:hypothetical protein